MIQENIKQIRAELPKGVRLVCVSKFHSKDDILEAYNVGERDFGESRVQELMTKQPVLPSDIRWHFIGPLQTNKIKQIVPFVSLIHSIENMRQIEEIQKCAAKIGRVVDILLEVHIAREEQKHGFERKEIIDFFEKHTYEHYPNVRVCGVMAIATLTDDEEQIAAEFTAVRSIFDAIKSIYPKPHFCELSIGMSDDYPKAIEAGSTMVRIGSKIFGARIYNK